MLIISNWLLTIVLQFCTRQLRDYGSYSHKKTTSCYAQYLPSSCSSFELQLIDTHQDGYLSYSLKWTTAVVKGLILK